VELVGCIQRWLEEIGREIDSHIALDGKTLARLDSTKPPAKNPLHLVSAWPAKPG